MRVIKNIILIISIASVILFILNRVYLSGYKKYYRHETERIAVLMDRNFYTDVIFLGSSRTHVHNNPAVVDSITHLSSYNFGIEGANLLEMKLWLEIYFQKHTNPKLVLLDLPAFAFDTQRRKFYNPTIYFPYLNNDIIYSTLLKYNRVGLFRYIPFLEFIEINDYDKSNAVKGLMGQHDQLSNVYSYRGFVENPIGKVPHDTTDYKITHEANNCFKAIISLCKQKGSRLVVTYSPEYYDTDYRHMQDFFSLLQYECAKASIPFWDYRRSPICRDSTLFANPGHLKKAGADVFSAELARDILQELGKRPG